MKKTCEVFSTFRRFRGFAVQSESAESAEIFSFNFLEILKALPNCVYLTCDFEYLALRCYTKR